MKTIYKRGLTLLEMVIVLTGFFLLLTIIMQIYMQMMNLKNTTDAKQSLIQESYFMLEKLNVEFKDYTIDYEEYFNRSVVGCDNTDSLENFTWNIASGINNGYCDNFTAYGNQNTLSSFGSNTNNHVLYYCSYTGGGNPFLNNPLPVVSDISVLNGSGCVGNLGVGQQAYGQYALQFRDVKEDVDFTTGVVGDSDDTDLGIGPEAIYDTDNIQELYLISQDNTKRILIRRALISSGDWNNDGTIGSGFELRYTLQMLKLKGFDAGKTHSFDINEGGVYDGKIDTWACDYAEGFLCHGDAIDSLLYSGYYLPVDENDGWVNIFQKNLTIDQRNIHIAPYKDAKHARLEDELQINPYATISFTNKLYGEIRKNRLPMESLNNFQLTLQTTFNIKTMYAK